MNQVLPTISHELNVDVAAMGGDINGERNEKEPTSLIPTSPQTPNSTDGKQLISQLLRLATLWRKRKRVQRRIRNLVPRGVACQGNLYVAVCTPLYFLMMIGCWNVRGLNDPIKHSELRRLIHQERMVFFWFG